MGNPTTTEIKPIASSDGQGWGNKDTHYNPTATILIYMKFNILMACTCT
jgi:hypothetical protein